MSVSGLYDSARGDALARKSMLCFKKPEDGRFHKERFCACGGLFPHLPKHRDGKAVCDMCAEVISRRKRAEKAEKVAAGSSLCTICGRSITALNTVIRNGKKCCRSCGAKERTLFARTYSCTKCGEYKPTRFMVRRDGQYYCKECGSGVPLGRDAKKYVCSVCGKPSARVFLKQFKGKLFCRKCHSNK